MNINLLEGFLTRAQLAESLNITSRTISRYELEPNGLPSLTIGGRKLYRVSAVVAWIDGRERKPNPRRRVRAA